MATILVTMADRLVQAVAMLVMLALLCCVVLGVASRQLGDPLAWTDELAQYFLVWAAVAGWMIALRRQSHIRITTLVDLLPAGARRGAEIAIQLAVLAFGALLLRHGTGLIARTWDIEAISLPIPSAVVYLPLPALAVAVMLQSAAELAAAWRGPAPAAAPGATGP